MRHVSCPALTAKLTLLIRSGPLISPAAKQKVTRLIESVSAEGGKIHLDGRGITVPGYESGNFVGPTVVEGLVNFEAYK